MNRLVISFLAFLSLTTSSFAADGWIGNFGKQSERSPGDLCQYSKPLTDNTVTFDSWDATRAMVTVLCFEVYVPGVTDLNNSAPNKFDVYAMAGPNEAMETSAQFVEKRGNNYVYAVDLKTFNTSRKVDRSLTIAVDELKSHRSLVTNDSLTLTFPQ